ncbi:Alpha/Beta hydrolase protein [Mycena amicta]|nr:Alpha/Beta hydrolase protein [Mycena amicta]
MALPRLAILTFLSGTFVAHIGAKSPIVDLGYARYQGSVDTSTNITSFLGLRYAASPGGDARFRAPQPPLQVDGLQKAIDQPPQCWQVDDVGGGLPTNPFREPESTVNARRMEHFNKRTATNVSDEDCLFLSVYYPSDTSGTPPNKLPVVVWIHGGGYLLGSSSQFRGSDLIKQADHGLVVVIIQYRLGLFGFLAGAQVKQNGALNAGLLDQQFALQWVNQHIAKFGGDPDQVTIWGESAGGGSVLQHVIANGGKTTPQLFRRAIASSSFVVTQSAYDERVPQLVYDAVVEQTNCTSSDETGTLACLRNAPVDLLQAANININANTFVGTFNFAPVVDGELIQQRPVEALKAGKINGETVLAVTNAFEGRIFVNTSIPAATSVGSYALELYPKLNSSQAPQIERIYDGVGTTADKIVALFSDTVCLCPTYALLRAFDGSKAGSAFKAEFAIPPGNHGTDLQYYFPSLAIDVPVLNYPTFFNNTAFINAFARSFTSFARFQDADPGRELNETWTSWSGGNKVEMVFNRTDGADEQPWIRATETDEKVLERCRFWDAVGDLTGH